MSDVIKVSPSMLSGLQCPRYWRWAQNWWQTTTAEPLYIGQLVHSMLEYYYRHLPSPEQMAGHADKVEHEGLLQMKREFGVTWQFARETYEEATDLARGVFENYLEFDRRHPLLPSTDPTRRKVEQRIEFDWQVDGYTVRMSGKLDLIWFDHARHLHFADHKTYKVRPNTDLLDIDFQLSCYALLIWKALRSVPRRIVLNILYKGVPSPPHLIRRGSALSKSKDLPTTYQLYQDAIEEYGFDQADYLEILDHYRDAGWDQFFERIDVFRSLDELQEFEEMLVQAIFPNVIRFATEERQAYPVPTWGCNRCQFLKPCRVANAGGDFEYVLKQNFLEAAQVS